MSVRKATNCSLVRRGAVRPSTSPVAVLSAAKRSACRCACTQSRGSRRGPQRAATSGLCGVQRLDRGPSRPRRTPPRARAGSGTGRSRRRPWSRSPDRSKIMCRSKPVRSYAVLAPDALHRGKRHVAQLRGKLAAAPVGRSVGRSALERVVQYPRLELCRGLLRCPTGMARVHPRKSLFQKPTRPARDEARVALEPTHDRVARVAVFEHQNQFRSSKRALPAPCAIASRPAADPVRLRSSSFPHEAIEAQKGCALNASADSRLVRMKMNCKPKRTF